MNILRKIFILAGGLFFTITSFGYLFPPQFRFVKRIIYTAIDEAGRAETLNRFRKRIRRSVLFQYAKQQLHIVG